MDNTIYIPVSFEGKEIEFKAIVQRFGYSYRISVDVFDVVIQFEQDEEGQYRALWNGAHHNNDEKQPSQPLILAIANVITKMS